MKDWERMCGDCLHWRKYPTDPLKLPRPGDPRPGECRCMPPAVVYTQTRRHNGQFLVEGMVTAYPSVMDQFPACGQFCQSLKLAD